MERTLYAAFIRPQDAERAIGALIDNGVKPQQICLVVRDAAWLAQAPAPNQVQILARDHEPLATDPLGNHALDTPISVPGELRTELMPNDGSPDRQVHEPPSDYDAERAGKLGLTVTTPADAEKGALRGGAWGLGFGALAAVASLAVPGVGIVVGGGALASALVAAAAATGAGAVAGGVIGFLKDQGIPAHDLEEYEHALDGGAILSVHLVNERDRVVVHGILVKYGARSTNSLGYLA